MKLPIKTARLYITEFSENMAESVHINSLDEDNRRFIPDEVFETAEEARETINTLISFYGQMDKPLVYPILLHDGCHIGHVQAVPILEGWEIGYHITKEHTGNGYATEAVNAFLPIVMKYLGITHIYGICSAANIASRRVLEKCGFLLQYEGTGMLHRKEQSMCRYKKVLAHCRQASKDDAQNLKEIAKRVITTNYVSFLGAKATADFIESGMSDKEIDDGLENCTVMILNREIIGFAITKKDVLHLIMINVQYQNKGYGSGLLAHTTKKLFTSFDRIELQTFKENISAVQFYLKNGWTIVSKQKVPELGNTMLQFKKSRTEITI